MSQTQIIYLSVILLFNLGAWFALKRFQQSLLAYLVIWSAYACVSMSLATSIGRDIFDVLSLLGWGLFIGAVLLFYQTAYFARKKFTVFGNFLLVLGVSAMLVGIDCYLIEPNWMEIRRESLASAKLKKGERLRIGILSDLQTDHVGNFEKQALAALMEAKPDLILLPGDYIQAEGEQYERESAKLSRLLKELNVSAPLGVYATQGDVDLGNWTEIFAGLPITLFPKSGTVEQERFIVTGLNLTDSCMGYELDKSVDDSEKFHIIVGHRPDFALEISGGDLLVAGHTHGGQVQLPIYGPILTFSAVPRKYCAGGLFQFRDRWLLITRGLGMERQNAPRLRFLCRPEIVILDVVSSQDQ